jgi:ATP-dependent DNA helicase 2 subunit 2
MAKEASCIVIDVGPAMGQLNQLSAAQTIAKQLIRSKLLFTKRDEVGVIAMGSPNTDNPLSAGDDQYAHIEIKVPVRVPDLDMLEAVDAMFVDPENIEEADAMDALLVGLQVIHDRVQHYKFTKKLYLITACGSAIQDQDQLDEIADRVKDVDVRCNIITVVNPAHATPTQKDNLQFLENLVEKLGDKGVLMNIVEATQLVHEFRKKSVRSMPKYKGYLEWHPKLKFSVVTYAKTMVQNLPSLTRVSVPAEAAGEDAESTKVKMARSYINKFSETPDDLAEDQRVKAYKYGKTFIPFSSIDEKLLEYEAQPCFKLIAFIEHDKIPRHHYMSTVDIVYPEKGNAGATKGFTSLVMALKETRKAAILRLVKPPRGRYRSDPVIVCATPHIDPGSQPCLFLNTLPFDEDVREYQFANFMANEKLSVSQEQRDSIRNLIESLDLTTAAEDEFGYVSHFKQCCFICDYHQR